MSLVCHNTAFMPAHYFSSVVFFLLYGATILNMSSTTPFLPREIAFTAS